MSTIKELAKGYVPKQTKNIAELSEVSTDVQVFEGEGKNKDNEPFSYNYIEINGEEYRVPDKVLKDLKAIMEKKPSLKRFSVSKTGTGLSTQYTVIPLD